MYSVVLPIKATENGVETQNYVIFRDLGIPSFEKFWDMNKLRFFYAVCPARDVVLVEKVLEKRKLPYKVISEDSLEVIECHGWEKQQLVKLKMAEIVNTPYYLVLDSDHFLTRNFSYSDMFENRRIKYSYEPWQTENDHKYSTNSRWWENSSRLLKFPLSFLSDKKDLMGVTPQILITNVVISMLKDIGEKWQEDFVREKATEFTLYWLYVLSKKYTHNYTTSGTPLWKHNLDTNILVQNQGVSSIRNAFSPNLPFFSVIQGYLHQDNQRYIKEGQKYLSDRKHYECVFLLASMLTPNRPQSFHPYERFQQTVHSLQKIREKIPNSLVILIEGSQISDMVRNGFKKYCDYVLELDKDTDVSSFVNQSNIGSGEMKLLERGITFLEKEILPYADIPLIFKLTPRYSLTDSFKIENFPTDKYSFKTEYDTVLQSEVYSTKFYSVPASFLKDFKQTVLIKGQEFFQIVPMIEKIFYDLLPKEKVNTVGTLGIEGMLSYNKMYFSI